MIRICELASLFDDTICGPPIVNARSNKIREQQALHGFWRPDRKSLAYIEKRLQFRLPASLVDFARMSNAYPRWFLSLGQDYANPLHILRMTNDTRHVRRRKNGRWQYIKPQSLIPITVGYDGDYHCLDVSCPGPFEGEFEICYWSVPMSEGCDYELDFPSYVLKLVLYWSGDKLHYKNREYYTHIYERAGALLEEHENSILAALCGNT